MSAKSTAAAADGAGVATSVTANGAQADAAVTANAQSPANADGPASAAGPANAAGQRAVTLYVCTTCRDADGVDRRPRPGERLAEATAAANTERDVTVVPIECLGNCKRRLSAALTVTDGWTYVFGGLSVDNAADLVAGAALWRDADSAVLPWRGRPACLKAGMVARVPPLGFSGCDT